MSETGIRLLAQGSREMGIALDQEQLRKFTLLLDELQKWNRKINLTAVRDEQGIVIKHFIDSLSLVKYLPLEGTLLDMGSGAGFPSIPLKICLPQLKIVSVDAVEKKILFQRQAARLLGLQQFVALHERIETLPPFYEGHFDVITSRAFSEVTRFARLAVPLLADGGILLAMKGGRGAEETAAAAGYLADLKLSVTELKHFALPIGGDERTIVVMRRI